MKSLNLSNSVAKSTSRHAASAAVLAAALVAMAAPTAHAVLVGDFGTFTLGPTSKFNIQNNAIIVRTTPYLTIRGYVTTGFAAGAWNGVGINSGNAAAGALPTAVGVIDNTDAGFATFFTVPIGADDALVRYTYYGDADFNGKVDNDDYALTDTGYGIGSMTWFLGDFDYNNTVDNDDYALLDAGFGGQGAPLVPALTGDGPKAGAVPEPTSLGLLALGALGLAGRRRR